MYKKSRDKEPTPPTEQPIPTKERLARDIEALMRAKQDEGLRPMMERARVGYYDDYESPLETPCIQLVADFRALGYEGMAHKAMDGRWDGTRAEGDSWAAAQTDPDVLEALRLLNLSEVER